MVKTVPQRMLICDRCGYQWKMREKSLLNGRELPRECTKCKSHCWNEGPPPKKETRRERND